MPVPPLAGVVPGSAAGALPDDASGAIAGRSSVLPDPTSCDPDSGDAVGRPARIGIGGGVDVQLRIEEDEIGSLPLRDASSIGEAEAIGRPCGESPDCLLDRYEAVADRKPFYSPMTISDQIFWLVILSMVVASISWTVTQEEIFSEWREKCEDKSKTCGHILQRKFFYVFTS